MKLGCKFAAATTTGGGGRGQMDPTHPYVILIQFKRKMKRIAQQKATMTLTNGERSEFHAQILANDLLNRRRISQCTPMPRAYQNSSESNSLLRFFSVFFSFLRLLAPTAGSSVTNALCRVWPAYFLLHFVTTLSTHLKKKKT